MARFAPEKTGAAQDLLGGRPVEQRFECLPVVVELGLQSADALPIGLRQGAELCEGCEVGAVEFGQLLPVFRSAIGLDVEEVVPDEDAGQFTSDLRRRSLASTS